MPSRLSTVALLFGQCRVQGTERKTALTFGSVCAPGRLVVEGVPLHLSVAHVTRDEILPVTKEHAVPEAREERTIDLKLRSTPTDGQKVPLGQHSIHSRYSSPPNFACH